MIKIVTMFFVFFICSYIMYYFLFVRKQLRYSKKKVYSDVKLLESYYKIDVKKIGYKKVLRILNFVNSLLMSFVMTIIMNFDKYIYMFLVALVLMFPLIWVVYYFLAMYLKSIENKSKKK